jgi:hypothetical protein
VDIRLFWYADSDIQEAKNKNSAEFISRFSLDS